MKATIRFLFAAILAAAMTVGAQEPAAGTFSLKERDLIRELAGELTASLSESAVPADVPLAILPIIDDRADFAYGLFKTAGTNAKRNIVEGRDDAMWETIVSETAWNLRKGSVGVLDRDTLTSFEKLQAANLLLYGNVIATVKPVFFGLIKLTRVEAELHVSSVVTKQHLWGGTFVHEEKIPWGWIIGIAVVVIILLKLFISAMTRAR